MCVCLHRIMFTNIKLKIKEFRIRLSFWTVKTRDWCFSRGSLLLLLLFGFFKLTCFIYIMICFPIWILLFFPCWKTLFCLTQKTINQNNPVRTEVNSGGCRLLLLVCTHVGTCTQEERLSYLLSLLHQTEAISQILILFPGESTRTNPWTEALLLTLCLYLGSCNYMLPKQQISRQEGRGLMPNDEDTTWS